MIKTALWWYGMAGADVDETRWSGTDTVDDNIDGCRQRRMMEAS
jgi:hypothetical protein